jgi:hypothetical protein
MVERSQDGGEFAAWRMRRLVMVAVPRDGGGCSESVEVDACPAELFELGDQQVGRLIGDLGDDVRDPDAERQLGPFALRPSACGSAAAPPVANPIPATSAAITSAVAGISSSSFGACS